MAARRRRQQLVVREKNDTCIISRKSCWRGQIFKWVRPYGRTLVSGGQLLFLAANCGSWGQALAHGGERSPFLRVHLERIKRFFHKKIYRQKIMPVFNHRTFST
jgi:hypothetical protein